MPKGENLTEKQKRFADCMVKYDNATKAYHEAGYSAKSDKVAGVEGHKLLKKPKIKEYINKRLEEMANERVADAQEVLQFYTSIMRGEVDEEVLRGVGEGEQTIDRMEVNGANRLKAADALAKRYGLFKDNINLEGDMSLNIEIDYGDDDGNES